MSTDIDELITWLRTQIDEDEEAARKRMHHAQENHLLLQDPKYLGRFIPGWHEWPEIEAAAAHVLAVCEAHTAILDRAQFVDDHGPARDNVRAMDMTSGASSALRDVLRLLALAYQHRPGYRKEWQA